VVHSENGKFVVTSAIDFSLHIEKEPDPKGDRVKVTMSGKFLPYKKF
jgi:cyanate lyase